MKKSILPLVYFSIFLFLFLVVVNSGKRNYFRGWILIDDYQNKTNSSDLIERFYSRLASWDGHWYFWIAKKGYFYKKIDTRDNPHECNVAFFPLGPMFGSILNKVFNVRLDYGIQIFNQILTLLSFFSSIKFYLYGKRKVVSSNLSKYNFIPRLNLFTDKLF